MRHLGLWLAAVACGAVSAVSHTFPFPPVHQPGRRLAYQEVLPHENNIFKQVGHLLGKGVSGTKELWSTSRAAMRTRQKRKHGEPTTYGEELAARRNTDDLLKFVLTSFLLTRSQGASQLGYLLLYTWPKAFIPSVYDDTTDRLRRLEQQARDLVAAPVTVLRSLDDQTRVNSIKWRKQHDEYLRVYTDVLSASTKHEALQTLDQFLVVEKKSFWGPLNGLPPMLVKAGHKAAATDAPGWMPAFVTKSTLTEKLTKVAELDDLLEQHFDKLTRTQLIYAAQARGISATRLSNRQLRDELRAWLELVHEDPARDPLRTRLAVIGLNAVEAARVAPEGSDLRMLFESPLPAKAP